MPAALHLSIALYRALLVLYPRELRQRFGTDMAQVFADELSDAWRAGGYAAAMKVWQCALWELFSVALSEQLTSGAVVVPVLSALTSLALFLALFWGLTAYNAIPHHFAR